MRMKRRTETGQVLILLTVGIITLLGFTALAIDGGRLYSEKRTVQGVSDSSSLTGALYLAQHIRSGVDATVWNAAYAAAYQRADSNGYDGSITMVDITEDANYYYVETTIHSSIPPTIVQLVYDGPLSVTAISKARVPKSNVFALGQALVSLGGDCPGLWFHGTADFEVHNTGIFSNAADCYNSVWFSGSPAATIDGYIYSVGDVDGDEMVTSDGVLSADPIDAKLTTEPDCSKLDDRTDSGNSLQPGVYANGISIGGNADVTLAAGLYCLDDDFRIQNGTTIGNGVTIYMRSGGVTINGGDNTLTAPLGNQWADGADPARYWNGMLFFFSGSNDADLSIAGNAASEFSGTIYNYDGECSLTGTDESVAFNTQVVCDTIEVSGTGYLDITYNPEEVYKPPVNIDLVK